MKAFTSHGAWLSGYRRCGKAGEWQKALDLLGQLEEGPEAGAREELAPLSTTMYNFALEAVRGYMPYDVRMGLALLFSPSIHSSASCGIYMYVRAGFSCVFLLS